MYETEIVEVELPDGEIVLAEVEVADGDVSALDRFKLDEIGPAAARIGVSVKDGVLRSLPRKPDRLGISFGLKLAVKSGKLASVLAEASTEASVTITMEWDRESGD